MMSNEIQVETDNGSAFGYVISTREQNIKNYLSEHTEHAKLICSLMSQSFETVALLRNMHVEESERGNGEGSELVNAFLGEADQHGAQLILLISDTGEEQMPGFDLTKFYEKFGLTSCFETSAGMLMFSDEEFANRVAITIKRKEAESEICP